MSDDIVTRLRKEYDNLFAEWQIVATVLPNAADEIERLRDELAYWRNMAITLGDYMANVPSPILEAYSAIWQAKYAKRSPSNGRS
jgi:hypothetical protein